MTDPTIYTYIFYGSLALIPLLIIICITLSSLIFGYVVQLMKECKSQTKHLADSIGEAASTICNAYQPVISDDYLRAVIKSTVQEEVDSYLPPMSSEPVRLSVEEADVTFADEFETAPSDDSGLISAQCMDELEAALDNKPAKYRLYFYQEDFLKPSEKPFRARDGKQIAVSVDIHQALKTFCVYLNRDDITLSILVDNILSHHLKYYKEEINAICKADLGYDRT